MDALRTAVSTPVSSPELYSPTTSDQHQFSFPPCSDGTPQSSPYLHPLQMHKVRETSKAQVEQDFVTGRKLINQYEIINEIGRGMHGKVKLGRSLETGDYVAIKIIQRFSKKRKLGRVTFSPEAKTQREIAILKKVRHANVVGLLEVIDDPELKKIYMILEYVELGEIVWRRKGAPQICLFERRRIENEQMGEKGDYCGDEKYSRMINQRRISRAARRAQLSQIQTNPNYWSLEHGYDEDENLSTVSREEDYGTHYDSSHDSIKNSSHDRYVSTRNSSRDNSSTPSRTHTPLPYEHDIPPIGSDNANNEKSCPLPISSNNSNQVSFTSLNRLSRGSCCTDDQSYKGRSPSMADSIISHMSSIDNIPHDPFEDDFSYVPCFTIDQARSAFRDTVLGLEYLHYEGIVHRDIKPANLLRTKDHRVKISDFGVSYFGRPTRDDEIEENISEADATDFDDDLELAKTVGTPAFFAPELCCTDLNNAQPKITEQIDVWSLGITLYCLIFARIPFLAKDEWQLFRCIAKDDVYIPHRRLKAVCRVSSVSPINTGKRTFPSRGPYREENELAFEDVDDELYDLLKRMLVKDPDQRINLQEVKRHPWLLRGIDDIIGWLDSTDPSRETAGRRIEVNNHELERAVVPITFLERARTAVKKAVGKVIGVARNESKNDGIRGSRKSRRRALSSATSSGTESNLQTPMTPIPKSSRRCSLRGNESYFGYTADFPERQREIGEHCPLSQDLSMGRITLSRSGTQSSMGTDLDLNRSNFNNVDSKPKRCGPELIMTALGSRKSMMQRGHSYSRSVNSPTSKSLQDQPITPILKSMNNKFYDSWHSPGARELLPDIKESSISRVHSVDRDLFQCGDIHAEASVALNPENAPGHFLQRSTHTAVGVTQSIENCLADRLPSPCLHSFQKNPCSDKHSDLINTPLLSQFAPYRSDEKFATDNIQNHDIMMPRAIDATMTKSFLYKSKLLGEVSNNTEIDTEQEWGMTNNPLSIISTKSQPNISLDHINEFELHIPHRDALSESVSHKCPKLSSSTTSNSITSQMTSPVEIISPISSINLRVQEDTFVSIPVQVTHNLEPLLMTADSEVKIDEKTYLYARSLSKVSVSESLTNSIILKDFHINNDVSGAQRVHSPSSEDDEGYNGDGDTTSDRHDGYYDSDDQLPIMIRRAKATAKTSRHKRLFGRRVINMSLEARNNNITKHN